MNANSGPPRPPPRNVDLTLPRLEYGAVFGYVLTEDEYETYADKHQLALGEPHIRRTDFALDHMILCVAARGLLCRTTAVFPGPKMSDGIATCICIGSNRNPKWKQAMQDGTSQKLIDKMKEALGRMDDPQWYNKADI